MATALVSLAEYAYEPDAEYVNGEIQERVPGDSITPTGNRQSLLSCWQIRAGTSARTARTENPRRERPLPCAGCRRTRPLEPHRTDRHPSACCHLRSAQPRRPHPAHPQQAPGLCRYGRRSDSDPRSPIGPLPAIHQRNPLARRSDRASRHRCRSLGHRRIQAEVIRPRNSRCRNEVSPAIPGWSVGYSRPGRSHRAALPL
jgi:hypothetical protein